MSHASANGTKVDRIDSAIGGQLSSSRVSTARCREIIRSTSMRFVSFFWVHKLFSHFLHRQLFFSPRTESTSDLVEGQYASSASRLIYGVFTTSDNAIAGSAVCAFALQVTTHTHRGHFHENFRFSRKISKIFCASQHPLWLCVLCVFGISNCSALVP